MVASAAEGEDGLTGLEPCRISRHSSSSLVAETAATNQVLVSQCLLVTLRDSPRKNREEEQIKKFLKTVSLLAGHP